ncbi:hypothetical protein [Jiangella alkaliphila]|uniref:Mce-associated membrane protein n=1 Tax=Jiangella alkaliphila TaxID=419479 RepID=A0A1H2M4S8_9ACTN|nr:hypothetical protein [Jiangella alkaliphila]SDU88124.1 hypothetical protein SAMN04488563_7061 [Jiangella alkaliphila]
MSRRVLALGATVLVFLLPASCSSAGEEPAGLGDGTATGPATASASLPSEPSDEPDDSPSAPAPEPGATFTPPYQLEGEERVVELPSELPIEPPDGATDDERAVLQAAGRFMASWDAVLFGAGDEQSGIMRTAVDPQLGRLLNYLVESVSKRRVIVGEPTQIELRDVTVDDTTAEVDICTIMRDWVQYTDGAAEPQPEVERLVLTMTLVDGVWLASDTEQTDPESCE